jgi:hypothetical protein
MYDMSTTDERKLLVSIPICINFFSLSKISSFHIAEAFQVNALITKLADLAKLQVD